MQYKSRITRVVFLMVLLLQISCVKFRGHYGTRSFEPVARSINPSDIKLPPGYKIQAIAQGLTYPTAITFDESGKIYVLEAGYSYGESFTEPRLLQIDADGNQKVIAKGNNNGPWTNVDFF